MTPGRLPDRFNPCPSIIATGQLSSDIVSFLFGGIVLIRFDFLVTELTNSDWATSSIYQRVSSMLRRRLNAVFTRQTGGSVGQYTPVSTLQSGRVKIFLPSISYFRNPDKQTARKAGVVC